jgi:hypothetical protein
VQFGTVNKVPEEPASFMFGESIFGPEHGREKSLHPEEGHINFSEMLVQNNTASHSTYMVTVKMKLQK